MLFLRPTLLFGLVATICANPIPARFEGKDVAVYSQIDVRMASGTKIKDTTCPEYKITYTAKQISNAVKRENDKSAPGTYNNGEKIFNTKERLYKVSLDSESDPISQYSFSLLTLCQTLHGQSSVATQRKMSPTEASSNTTKVLAMASTNAKARLRSLCFNGFRICHYSATFLLSGVVITSHDHDR